MSFTTFCPLHGVSYGSRSCWHCEWDRGGRTAQPEEQFAQTVRHGIKWISVNDRLPPEKVTVLVWGNGPSTAERVADAWMGVVNADWVYEMEFDCVARACDVTHWAEIEGPQE